MISFLVLFSAINNLVNFLVALNAASNFLLYCALSDKYRKTVKALIFRRVPVRKNTISSSRYNSGRTNSSFYSKSLSNGIFLSPNRSSLVRTPPALSIPEQPRFSITQEDYANLQAKTGAGGNKGPPGLSITPTETHRKCLVSISINQLFWWIKFTNGINI